SFEKRIETLARFKKLGAKLLTRSRTGLSNTASRLRRTHHLQPHHRQHQGGEKEQSPAPPPDGNRRHWYHLRSRNPLKKSSCSHFPRARACFASRASCPLSLPACWRCSPCSSRP